MKLSAYGINKAFVTRPFGVGFGTVKAKADCARLSGKPGAKRTTERLVQELEAEHAVS